MARSEDDSPPPPPPPPSQTPTQQTPHTVSTIKLHILKKGEYDIYPMKMEHYLVLYKLSYLLSNLDLVEMMNQRRSGKQEDSKALVTIDGEGVDWTSHSEEKEDYALMACNSSDTE
ncbi:hypothetical protein Tco_1572172, partial [Tanacetum coccineum]